MDLYNIENRLMILECLRENSANMRVEQAHLRDRISQALVRARTSLLCIRQLNIELQEMKTTVDNALSGDFSGIDFGEVPDEVVDDVLTVPAITQEDEIDELSEELYNEASSDEPPFSIDTQ